MTVGSESKKPHPVQEFLSGNLNSNPGQQFLQQIIDNSYDSIFVTDKYGNVLLASIGTGIFMGYERTEDMIGKNVKDHVKNGLYDWSPTIEAIKTRSVVSGIVRNKNGIQEMATSKPLIDEHGEIVMVIPNARDTNLVDDYIAALEKERSTAPR